MIKFLKNLFNVGKKRENVIDVDVDKEKGIMLIRTDKELTPDEIMEILRKELLD